ncbi:hypothetical protein [Bdellovibrio sp. HCB337]|uniref:hypothetical protein n=1 Tax=Bdellovibrio sp. HCB337 TaxID=3394358 RepID=UPI0039A6F786
MQLLVGALSLCAIFFLQACGAGTGKNKNIPDDPLAQLIPYWAEIIYTSNGVPAILSPPFLTTQNILADMGTGSCSSNTMEIIFRGSYNPENISDLILSGLTATGDFSGNSFTFTACMAPGSANVTITAYDKEGKAVRFPLAVSLNAMTSIRTMGFGHPRYPTTGFILGSAAGKQSGSHIHMDSFAAKPAVSTGNTGYTMEIGFVNSVHQTSP